jgi:hypothetical protein
MKYSDFVNISNQWTDVKHNQLLKLYNEDLIDILQIAFIYKRAHGSISSRLKKLQVIGANKEARGYTNYKSTQLYQEAMVKLKLQQNY